VKTGSSTSVHEGNIEVRYRGPPEAKIAAATSRRISLMLNNLATADIIAAEPTRCLVLQKSEFWPSWDRYRARAADGAYRLEALRPAGSSLPGLVHRGPRQLIRTMSHGLVFEYERRSPSPRPTWPVVAHFTSVLRWVEEAEAAWWRIKGLALWNA